MINMMVLLLPKKLLCGIYLLPFRTRTLGVVSQFNYGECEGKESLTQGSRTIKTLSSKSAATNKLTRKYKKQC